MNFPTIDQYLVGLLAFVFSFSFAFARIQTVRTRAIRDKRGVRTWLTINDPDYMNRGGDLEAELVYGYRAKPHGLGFKFHIGGRYSETPVHFNLYGYFFAVFFAVNTPRLGRICEWIGRGHKRDLSLYTHGGDVWWKLWYDDDMGYDNYHECDRWRRIWWWPFKNNQYRGWACLRTGRLSLNPLSMMWGPKQYRYEDLDTDILLIEINDFPGDEYMVNFTVQDVVVARRRGPKFLRKPKHVYYIAEWDVPDGIPIRNHDWKGDGAYASGVKIKDPNDWRLDADDNLKAWVREQRVANGYRPPIGKLVSIEDTPTGLFAQMELWDVKALAEFNKNVASNMSIMTESIEKVSETFAPFPNDEVSKENDALIAPMGDGIVVSAPAEGDVSGMSIADNEDIKSKYTPEELAQQAYHRDHPND